MLDALSISEPCPHLGELGFQAIEFARQRHLAGPFALQLSRHGEQLGAAACRCLLRRQAATLLASQRRLIVDSLLGNQFENRRLPAFRPRQPQHTDLVDQIRRRHRGQTPAERVIAVDGRTDFGERGRRELVKAQEPLEARREGQLRAQLQTRGGNSDGQLERWSQRLIRNLVAHLDSGFGAHSDHCTDRRFAVRVVDTLALTCEFALPDDE